MVLFVLFSLLIIFCVDPAVSRPFLVHQPQGCHDSPCQYAMNIIVWNIQRVVLGWERTLSTVLDTAAPLSGKLPCNHSVTPGRLSEG